MEAINLPIANTTVVVKSLMGYSGGEINLKVGDTVQAKVIAYSGGKAVLNIDGLRLPVSTNIALNAGDIIKLMVVETGPQKVVFRQTGGAPEAIDNFAVKHTKEALLEHLLRDTALTGADLKGAIELIKGEGIEIGKGLDALEKAISLVAGKPGIGAAADSGRVLERINELIIRSGDKQEILGSLKAMVSALSYEANLVGQLENDEKAIENIKSALLEYQARLQNSPQKDIDPTLSSLKSAIGKVLDMFKAIEVLNLPLSSQSGDFHYLCIPIKAGRDMTSVELKISSDGSSHRTGSGQPKIYNIAFALDMPSLGMTRAWLQIVDKLINFSIAVENQEGLREAGNLLGDLQRSLEGLGYEVGAMVASLLKRDSLPERTKSLIEEKIGIGSEGIDLRA